MMQNNPMGAMMPQGVAPAASTGLNFQSDPSMRAQFKGFMSGMQAKQPAPAAPMAPMMQQPLPMPPSMQNIDIFHPSMPVKSYFMGGSVDYSDPFESPGTAGTVNFSSGGPEEAAFGGSGDGNRYDSLGNTVNFTSASAPPTASDSDPAMDALSQALANTAQVNQAQKDRAVADLGVRFDQIQGQSPTGVGSGPTAVGGMPETLTGASRAVDALIDPNLGFREFDRNIDLLGDPFNPNDIQAMQNPVSNVVNIATPTSRPDDFRMQGPPQFIETDRRSGIRTFDPSAPNVSVEAISGTVDYPGTVFDRDVDNFLAAKGTTMSPSQFQAAQDFKREQDLGFSREGLNEGQISGAPQLGFDLGGMGAEGEAVPAPSSAVQQAADKARAEALDITEYDPNAEVPEIFTTAKGNAAMDKLLDRAQNFGQSGIGGFLNKITGGRANFANRMASDIINKGYTPIFDRAGNIVATRNPETGQLGAGSVEARIPGMAGSGGGGGAPQMSVADQVAVALKRLGIGEDDEGEKAPPMINRPPEAGPGDPITFPVNPPTEAAQVGNPLGLGYGQISGLTPNLNSAADDFLRLLGGGR